jgi:hypothetical protein
MPKALIVISDMQFDEATYRPKHETFYASMVKKYNQQGYQMPNIVFWNVGSYGNTFQVTNNKRGVQMFSGHSASVFKSILDSVGYNAYEAMLQTLNDPIYDRVTI